MHRRPRRPTVPLAAAGLVTAGLVLAGCQGGTGTPGTVDVLASFYPLQLVSERVGGDHVRVQSLTPPGAEPHDVELSPAQVAKLSSADLVVYLSGFQAAVDDAVEQTGPQDVLDAADVVDLEPAHEDEHDGEEHTADDGHEHGDLDPHFWLDPTRLAAVVPAVEQRLAALDPEHASEFAANAAELTRELTALDEEYAAGLRTCEQRTFVTSHAAFGYLAERYDLEQVAISGVDPEAEPSPARLAEVEREVREQGVTTIFFETLVSPKVAQTLAADLGVRTAVLDPIEGVTEEGSDYFSVARDNLEALRVALSCS
ncbi:metal ABC transporter substrate-binding protein [Cellulomonas massiliensis]|uniref:metal ABC transporter substrate-binding protein n=1 Tax=Cellulomonas massiliensis TaxID=1465811 RepID=UPI0002DCCF56|nr:metal ABC transporter substrate-binding protein [Cellulomonas massiliensis]